MDGISNCLLFRGGLGSKNRKIEGFFSIKANSFMDGLVVERTGWNTQKTRYPSGHQALKYISRLKRESLFGRFWDFKKIGLYQPES